MTSLPRLAEFTRGVGLLIHDAQYVEADMPAKQGWGHSLVSDVLELARQAEASTVALFHHEPERDDEALDRIGVSASVWLKEKGSPRRAPWWPARGSRCKWAGASACASPETKPLAQWIESSWMSKTSGPAGAPGRGCSP